MDTVEKKFGIHRFAADGLLQATASVAALKQAAAELNAKADALYQQAVTPVLQMLGVEEGTVVRVDEDDTGPMLTVRVPVPPPKPDESKPEAQS